MQPGSPGPHVLATRPFDVTNRGVVAIALPMTLAYLSTPLVGLIDTAVIGRLGIAALMGGIAIGAVVFDFIFSVFNFLRNGTTGLTAQALGAGDVVEERAVFLRFLLVALGLGIVIIVLRDPVADLGIAVMGPSAEVASAARRYIDIRIFATPFVLANYAMLGWLLGLGRAHIALVLQILLNGLNIGLNLFFVLALDWSIEGVAAASLIAETATFFAGLAVVMRVAHGRRWPAWRTVFSAEKFRRMTGINGDIMVRSFGLLIAFGFFTRESARSGDIVLATNAVLMNLFILGGYFLDGFAAAAEQLAGRAVGARYRPAFDATIRLTLIWGGALSLGLTAAYFATGPAIIDAMTTNEEVRALARVYLPWAALTPVTAVLAFQMDGVFIGSTWSGDMRNMMLLSLVAFFAVWWVAVPAWGVHGLWLALLVFLALRGITLSWRCRAKADETFGAAAPQGLSGA
ncbi:MATE family multidrug resistance protein [Rhodobium orientis]|uniref:MATE family efflux transporter n=1 Tax=Rhodobium orientis TaxID=34017 RepID=A0A327JPT3_9HYPH|nr:MATE family efflux transporter [Rhodobium orientis]MBB4304876.1 MATE family multidrug resistance protein [Rhodobium orientis]MBK5949205.1 MATE family efflux transporter [Rhodobium orientis]RAI27374.1 MATE family efflux transporter [Rhodobium orientis]